MAGCVYVRMEAVYLLKGGCVHVCVCVCVYVYVCMCACVCLSFYSICSKKKLIAVYF